ncbi:MAG: hypothetical protein PVG91_12365 [Gammaproteobacteria bacterium]|jgi:hypothetical protein
MLTFVFVIVVSIAIIGSMWMFRNLQAQGDSAESSLFPVRDKQTTGARDTRESDFHAVSIRPCRDACSAAKALRGQRFLSHNPPFLPLSDCDQTMCNCRYQHHSDRRSRDDRRDGLGLSYQFSMDPEGMERRSANDDRRAS